MIRSRAVYLIFFFLVLHAGEESAIVLSWKTKFDSAKTMTELKELRAEFENYFDSLKTTEAVYDSFYVDQAYIYYLYPDAIWRIQYTSRNRLKEEKVPQDSLFKIFNDIKREEKEVRLEFLTICQQIENISMYSGLERRYRRQKHKYDEMQFRETIDKKPLPDFLYTTLDGQSGRLYDHRGKYVLLYFWAMDSPPCIDEIANVRGVYGQFQDSLVIIGISADTVKSDWQLQVLKNFIKEMDITWSQVADGTNYAIHRKYFVSSWPTIYLIDKEGYNAEVMSYLRGEKLEENLRKNIFRE